MISRCIQLLRPLLVRRVQVVALLGVAALLAVNFVPRPRQQLVSSPLVGTWKSVQAHSIDTYTFTNDGRFTWVGEFTSVQPHREIVTSDGYRILSQNTVELFTGTPSAQFSVFEVKDDTLRFRLGRHWRKYQRVP